MTKAQPFPRRRLKYVATINDEALTEDTHPDEEIQYIDIGNVSSNGEVNEIATYRFKAAPSRARRIVRNGDVIISTVRTYLQAITHIENPPENLIVSTGFAVIRPKDGILDAGFSKFALRERQFLDEVMVRSTGVSYPAITAAEVADIPISLPPLPTQRRVADFLDRETAQIDALIEAKEQMLTLLQEKRAAQISHMVTKGLDPNAEMKDSGLEWLGEIPAHWEARRLKFLITDFEQGYSPQCYSFPAEAGNWGVLKTGCVNGGVFHETENKTLPDDVELKAEYEVMEGDVLMSRASGSLHYIGATAYVGNQPRARLLLSDKIYRIKLNSQLIQSSYFVNLMNSYLGRYQIRLIVSGAEGLANNIARSQIIEFSILLPPKQEQIQINSRLEEENHRYFLIKNATEDSLMLLRERRRSLITAAVTGQLAEVME